MDRDFRPRLSAGFAASVSIAMTLCAAGSATGPAPAPSFAFPPHAYPTGRDPWSAAIGDLNGDGKSDLATANQEADTISMLLNKGNASFRSKRDYRTGQAPVSVAIGDLDGDG